MIPGSANPLLLAGAAEEAAYQIDRSLRFNSADSAYLNRTPSSAGNRKTWTWSGWVKRSKLGAKQQIFGVQGTSDTTYAENYFASDDKLYLRYGYNSVAEVRTTQVFRDPSAWLHIVIAFDVTQSANTDKLKLYINGSEITSFSTDTRSSFSNQDYGINRAGAHKISGEPNASSSYLDAYLADVHFIDGQALAPTDFGEYDSNNVWQPKEYSGTYGTNGFHLDFSDNSSNSALGDDSSGNNNDWTVNNLVAASTVWSDVTTPSNTSTQFPFSRGFDGVITGDGGTSGFAGWLASAGSITITFPSGTSVSNTIDIYHGDGLNGSTTASITVDGTTTTSSSSSGYVTTKSFSSISGDLESITLTQAGGGVRFYGIAIDGTTLVDVPGSVIDSLIDTPTNYEADSGNNAGNYCTLNPLKSGSGVTLSDGNLKYYLPSGSNYVSLGTIGMSSGKWYCEYEFTAGLFPEPGIAKDAVNLNSYLGGDAYGWMYYGGNGEKYNNGVNTSYSATYGIGDVIGIAFDADNGNLTFYKNGSSQGVAFSGLTNGPYFFAVGANNQTAVFNFGQRPFAYTPPTGYKSLCTTNLDDPTIADGSTEMDVVTYSGTSATRSFTDFNFSPDFAWIKTRNVANDHNLVDIVRGAPNILMSNKTDAEITNSTDGFVSFDSNGFTLGANSLGTQSDELNKTGFTYVGWAWDGGTSTVSNTDGSITSSVRANASAGFSIVEIPNYTYPTKTAGHGLNAEPEFIISKNTGASNPWMIYHKSAGVNTYFQFDTGAGYTGVSGVWSGITSSVFPLHSNVNQQTDIVAYCFAPVEGYSAFGKWTGGSDAFVYLGFRPRFLLIKANANGYDWLLFDSERSTFNLVDDWLSPNLSAAEVQNNTVNNLDFLSNGFKIKGTGGYLGASVDMLYAAFAEHPFKYSRAR